MKKRSKYRRLAVLLTTCMLAGLLRTAAQTGYEKLKLADYYQKQDFEGAIQYLRLFSDKEAGTVSFNRDLGYALFMNEEYKAAKPYFEKGLLLAPGDIELSLYLAQLFYTAGDLDSSLFFYNQLIKAKPLQYRFWQKAGSLYYRLNNYDSAFFCYQHAYGLNNRSGRIAVDLCNLFIQRKRPGGADSLIGEFLIRDTTDEEVIAKKIEMSFKKSLYDTVIRWGEKLWRDSSQLNLPFISLAYSYLNKEQYTACLRLCNWLDFGNRAGQSVLYCAALAYGKTGRYPESNDKLDQCIKMSIQDDARIYLAAKGDNFESMGNFGKAVSYYDTAWYIFHSPFDLYFAGRIYDKYYKNRVKTAYYYRLFQRNRPLPANGGEKRVMDYVDDFVERFKKGAVKKN